MTNFVGETIESLEVGNYSHAKDEDGLGIIHTLTLHFKSGKKMEIWGESVYELDLDTSFESIGYGATYNK